MYKNFSDLLAQQNVYEDSFKKLSTEREIEKYNSTMKGDVVEEVDRMRKIALDRAEKGDFNIEAGHWFSTMTKKINLLYEVDKYLSTDITNSVIQLKSSALRNLTIIISTNAVILVVVIFISYVTSKNIASRLAVMLTAINKLEGGDLTVRLDTSGADEISSVTRGFNKLVEKLHEIINNLVASGQKLKISSDDLSQASLNLSSGMEETSVQSQTIASAAVEMNQNLQLISSSMEEMSISGGEMARNASEAAKYSSEANKKTESTHELFTELNKNAKEIGSVIDSITTIAKQTNLLALNASIEAASAGAAGKGFAVVASEVKELAMQSSKASDSVRNKIQEIQKNVEKAVEAISEINVTIEASNQATTTIASAVEEQSIASKEIAGNISQTTQASNEVAKNINGISQASVDGSREAAKTSQNAEDLKKLALEIHEIVKQFKV